jgi:hypothetical protein
VAGAVAEQQPSHFQQPGRLVAIVTIGCTVSVFAVFLCSKHRP